MTIDYGSVCSGIESVSVAVHPLGWAPAWFAEIEPFPSAVLAHRFPEVPNHGDMTALPAKVLRGDIPAPAVLVGGTPCQAFSVAGMRQGLADPRGALTIKFVELANAIDHARSARGDDECVVWWENVPGVLSDKGNAFGCFLAALVGESDPLEPSGTRWTDAGCVYGPQRTAAWRVLDAQYFGLAQRRRRVFVVASARRGFDPAAVLFESEGVRRDSAPRRGEGQDVAGHAPFGPALQCGCGCIHHLSLGAWGCPNCEGEEGPAVEVLAGVPAFSGEGSGAVSQAGALLARGQRGDMATETFCIQPGQEVAGTLQSSGKAAGSATQQDAESGLLAVHGTQDPCISDTAFALGRNHGQENAVFAIQAGALRANPNIGPGGIGIQSGHAYTLEARAEVQAVCVTGDVAHTLKAEGFDASEDGTGRGQPIIAAFAENSRAELRYENGDGGIAGALSTGGGKAGQGTPSVQVGMKVRRLTPLECERLQGFPDNWTQIPWRGKPASECPDGPRYKAVGNSKATYVVRWIARHIQDRIGENP